jgi:hypothetical protein
MGSDTGEWPSTRWRLTAPESYVLQIPQPLQSVHAFKLALRELVLRRALLLEQPESAGLIGRRRPKSVVRAGPEYASVSEPALIPLLELHARSRERRGLDGVLVEDFASAARREFTRSFAGYVNDHVYPSLAERGLMELEESKRLGVVRRRVHVLTPAGREAAAELDEWLRIGYERLADWGRAEPQRALAYAGGAGAAILLMPSLYPEFNRLGKHVLLYGEAGAGGPEGTPDDFDFGGFDGFDAGFDAGGGWGGGDGGGGGGDGGGG